MAIYCAHEGINCLECTTQLKKARGCSEEINGQFAGFEINRCPRTFVGLQEVKLLQAYSFFKRGFFPNTGTWMQQPNKLIEACEIIERIIKDIEEREKDVRQKH